MIDLDGKPESVIQRLLLAHVNTLPDTLVWRANCGGAKIGNRYVYFGRKGQADLSGLIRGTRLEIECKRLAGGRQSPDQREFQRDIEQHGGIYLLAVDFDPTMKQLCDFLGVPWPR